MTLGPKTGSARAYALASVGLCLTVMACREPVVGERSTGAASSTGPRVVVDEAWLDLHGHVVATLSLTQDDLPLSLAELTALSPRLTLATLGDHPVDGLRAWKSQLLTGSQTAAKLPPAGPGTPAAAILSNVRQPGWETPAAFVDLGGGRYRYVFMNALTAFDPDETIRVGAWLEGAAAPSLDTSSTFDFRPSGGPVEARDTVLDESCGRCHGTVVHHGRRSRVRLCLTCHTWQNSDPDTIDPASMSTTAATDPNPLELGRLVHRIHRGSKLPTLYQSSSSAVPAPALNAGNDLPLPFSPENSTTAIVGRKFSVVGFQSVERVFGRVGQRTDNAQPARTVVEGVGFPRDLRDCAVCHGSAPQGWAATFFVSRRTCSGCHPDVWFGVSAITDQAHLAHPGGPQAGDGKCAWCHVDAALDPSGGSTLYAPVLDPTVGVTASVHVPLAKGSRNDRPRIEIVRVDNLRPGFAPSITFRLSDRVGPIAPSLAAPVPAAEPDSATSSFVPRAFKAPTGYLAIKIAGPTAPDYGIGNAGWSPISSGVTAGNPDPLLLTTGSGTDEYVYTFSSIIPATASGTWAVGMEARRRVKVGHYDKSKDVFLWPYSGETVSEIPDNRVAYVDVDVATGTWPPAGSVPRRRVVAQEKCERCHDRLALHGGTRNQVEQCLLCHIPQATDWGRRPKVSGAVNLGATFDGIEERSIHFKVMIHRIHTGGRTGAASLEGILPHVIYGPFFFDEAIFPNDLRNCTVCHEGKSYLVDAVPPGAAPTVANETGTVRHAANAAAHVAGELSRPPIQAACTGCHATGATFAHVAWKTVAGVETCPQCHVKGALSVEVVHGLAPPAGGVAATFSSIVQGVLVPRCATAACHSGNPPPFAPQLDADTAYGKIVGAQSGQSSLKFVEPGAPEESYLVHKLRGTASSVGGSVATIMPPDGALAPADLAAIEAWISNGAPND